MPQRDFRDLLRDIIRYGEAVQTLVDDGGYEAMHASRERRLAIERALQIAGEAFTQALKQDEQLTWRITDAPKIVAFRHLLTHHYYKTSPLFLWDIATRNVPLLVQQTVLLLQQQAVGEELGLE